MNLYDLTVRDAQGNPVSLSAYRGKVLLIVNTATGCGFTPQYKSLQALYDLYQDKGFEVLDFPCNQFLGQAPGTEKEITEFCQLNYGVTFKTFAKVHVNGHKVDPLFAFLKKAAGGGIIKWNFTKFLINRSGEVVGRFSPQTDPTSFKAQIEALL